MMILFHSNHIHSEFQVDGIQEQMKKVRLNTMLILQSDCGGFQYKSINRESHSYSYIWTILLLLHCFMLFNPMIIM